MKTLIFVMLLFGCGRDTIVEKEVPVKDPTGSGGKTGSTPSNGKIDYQAMNALLQTYCKQCHATDKFMENANSLRQSRVREELVSRRMPTSRAKVLPDNIRSQMINWF